MREWTQSIRSYVFAFSSEGGDAEGAAPRLKDGLEIATKRIGGNAFISGMYVGGVGFFHTIPVESADDPKRHSYKMVTDGPLSVMKAHMLHGLARFPRLSLAETPALELYWPKAHPKCWEMHKGLSEKTDQQEQSWTIAHMTPGNHVDHLSSAVSTELPLYANILCIEFEPNE